MFDLSFLSTPMGVVLTVAACLAGSVAVMAVRAHLSTKRKTWSDIAQKCAELKLTHISTVFQCLAVNDVSGAIRAAEDLKKILLDDTQRKQTLLGAAQNIATDIYQDPTLRPGFNDFVTKLQNSNLPDKASTFASAVDELAHQQTLVQDMKAKLQAGLDKAKTDISAFNSKVASDVSNLASGAANAAGTVAAGTLAGVPAGPAGAAAGAGAAVVHLVVHAADPTTPPPVPPADKAAGTPAAQQTNG